MQHGGKTIGRRLVDSRVIAGRVVMVGAAGMAVAGPSVGFSPAARKVPAAGAFTTLERTSGPGFAGRRAGTAGHDAGAR